MYMSCTFINIRDFDLCNLFIQNIYKFSVLYTLCIVFVQLCLVRDLFIPFIKLRQPRDNTEWVLATLNG